MAQLEILRARAERTFAGRPIDQALAKVRAIVGIPNVPPHGEAAAQVALDKLQNGEEPTPVELAALELVIRLMRPAPLSRNGMLDPLPTEPGSNLYNPNTEKLWNAFRESVKYVLYSIGRIDMTPGGRQGTGFLVSPELLVTNRHVLAKLSYGTERLQEGQAAVLFQQELGSPEPRAATAKILSVARIHPTLDMALLRVALEEPRPSLPLSEHGAVEAEGVAAIGYPFDDGRNPTFVDAIFQSEFGVKRAALGEVMELGPDSLFHDCSTLGGNSGSPVFSLKTGRVVGVHRSGFFMYRNEAVAVRHLKAFVEEAA
jgi:S1-C subfamily serine protease